MLLLLVCVNYIFFTLKFAELKKLSKFVCRNCEIEIS